MKMRTFPGLRPILVLLLAAVLCLAGIEACKHPVPDPPADSGYPEAIANIVLPKCAGCHNAASAAASGGLRMDTWDQLFRGGNGGAVVIPYDSIENSVLLHFINTDPTRGHVAVPTMPLNAPPLSVAEYETIRRWIADGAPNREGAIPFASEPDSRQKLYVTTQGCDLLGVVDVDRNVIMRYLDIGAGPEIESPHSVRVSADGRYAYMCFTAGNYLYKVDTRNDQIVGRANIGTGFNGGDAYNTLCISKDGSKVMVVGFNSNIFRVVNTADMSVGTPIEIDKGKLKGPHGIASTPNFDTFFVTLQQGNVVYRIVPNRPPFFKVFSIDGRERNSDKSSKDPHEILMAPDHSKFFLTCQTSNEVRVMSTSGVVLDSINVGRYPQEMAISHMMPYLFVSCMEEPSSYAQSRGAVYVINYNTHQIVAKLEGDMFQPHGVAVDDQRGRVYVISRNIDVTGPPPHHTGSCGGRNGFYTVYNLNTLQRLNGRKYEIAVDPYGAAIRFETGN